MSIEMSLESPGLESVTNAIEMLNSLGSVLGSVVLRDKSRPGSDVTNVEILKERLKDSGRDFITSTSADREEIAKAAADEIERRLGQALSVSAVTEKAGDNLKGFATQLAHEVMRAAMKKLMEQVSDRIEEQDTNVPPLKELSKKTVARKGHDQIGKDTGQLLANLNPDGLGGQNIRVMKG